MGNVGQLFNPVVAYAGFYNVFNVFADLSFLLAYGNIFNKIFALQNFVKVALAENLFPAAGRTGRYTAYSNLHFAGIFSGRGAGAHGSGDFLGRGFKTGGSHESRVKYSFFFIHICFTPVYPNARGDEVGHKVVKFGNTAAFGVVGSQHSDIFLIGKRAGYKSAEYAFGANFDKKSYAPGVCKFHLFNPFDGAHNLLHHHIPYFGRIRRIEIGGNVRGYRELRRINGKAV